MSAPGYIPLGSSAWMIPPRPSGLTENFLLPNGGGLVVVVGGTHDERVKAMADFSDLNRMQDAFEPQTAGVQMPGPEILPDGPGEFEILEAELTQTPKQHQTIARIQIKALTGQAAGRIFERATFFNRQESLNYLGGELLALGCDIRRWSDKSKPLDKHIAETLATLKGIRFRGSKTTNTSNGQVYSNLFINSRSSTVPGQATPAPATTSSRDPF
jgi:hypothetical protein